MSKLAFFLDTTGAFQVHRAGCADVSRAIKAGLSGYGKNVKMGLDDSGAVALDSDSPKDVVLELWSDQIEESWTLESDPAATLLTGKVLDPQPEDFQPSYDGELAYSDDATWEPSTAWLQENLYLDQAATHFFPCIKGWAEHTSAPCDGSGKDWEGDPASTRPAAAECSVCHQTAAQMGTVPKKVKGKWQPKAVPAHSVEQDVLLFVEGTNDGKNRNTDGTVTKSSARREIATRVALAAAALVDNMATDSSDAAWLTAFAETTDIDKAKAEAKACIAQWMHGMPVDRDRFLTVLPRPDRSDWRA